MIITDCDFHTRYQQIAMANDETGELLLERAGGARLRRQDDFGWPTLAVCARVGPLFSLPLLVPVSHLVPH
jgi:hypothetical protein